MLLKLLTAPVSLPMAGMTFVFQQIADMADRELYQDDDDGAVREQLLLLQVRLEEGEVDDAEYVEQEAVLMDRLREIKARRRAELEQSSEDEMPAEANVWARRRVVVETPFDE